jgi:hypothetical protein
MAGYVIECALKAYLRKANIKFPTRGSAGHDIRGLWQRAFKLSDLKDRDGHRTFFVDRWSTSMRYETDVPPGYDPRRLVQEARRLSGEIRQQIRKKRWK